MSCKEDGLGPIVEREEGRCWRESRIDCGEVLGRCWGECRGQSGSRG